MQNQVEQHGSHLFKDGTVVIPGQVSYSGSYYSLALESTFGGEDINVSQFYNADSPVLLTGATSGATGTPDAAADSAVTLAGGNTLTFSDGYANPELAADSGDIIYIENRKPISRSSDQIEDIKVIVEC